MRVFISYASENRATAEEVHLALTGAGHRTFFDEADLPPGNEFVLRIQAALRRSDAVVFLASCDSLAPGSFALTELALVRERWRHPDGHVIPVRMPDVPIERVPAYLRAVGVLEREGNMPAEVVIAVEKLAVARCRSRLLVLVPALALGLALAGYIVKVESEPYLIDLCRFGRTISCVPAGKCQPPNGVGLGFQPDTSSPRATERSCRRACRDYAATDSQSYDNCSTPPRLWIWHD